MFHIHQNNENLTRKQVFSESDFTVDKLQLLSLASEVCYRRIITSECSALRQIEQDRIRLFEDAMRVLSSTGPGDRLYIPDAVDRALRGAYDVFSADVAKQDARFYDVSYGVDSAEGDLYGLRQH